MKPHVFLRRPEFIMVWGVYTTTYMTANYIVSTCEQHGLDDRLPKFFGTSMVNITACISKVRSVGEQIAGRKEVLVYSMTARPGRTVLSNLKKIEGVVCAPIPKTRALTCKFGRNT